ncbi:MAG TPA: CBS domain-containing protein, partial [Gemmatimonadaceae bacterium]|nr:CBS domain-containing protein [Gemmatimonadaceae bacterium]
FESGYRSADIDTSGRGFEGTQGMATSGFAGAGELREREREAREREARDYRGRDYEARNFGRVGGSERTDASTELGLGYRDFGEGRHRAQGEMARRTRWQREPTTARDVMTRNPKSVTRGASVQEIARIMREENTGVVPVVEENGRLVGLVTDRDVVMRSLAEGRNPLELRADQVMTDDIEAVTPDESLREVVDLMGDKQIRRVPVVDRDDRLVGIISMADVATRADFDEDLQDALEEISARRSFWSKLFG